MHKKGEVVVCRRYFVDVCFGGGVCPVNYLFGCLHASTSTFLPFCEEGWAPEKWKVWEITVEKNTLN